MVVVVVGVVVGVVVVMVAQYITNDTQFKVKLNCALTNTVN